MKDTTKFDPNINTGVLWTFIRVEEIMELDKLKNRNKELETSIDHMRHGGLAQQERIVELINDLYVSRAENETLIKRIDELEAQVPKIVRPKTWADSVAYGFECKCGTDVGTLLLYCPHCGAKLDWSVA